MPTVRRGLAVNHQLLCTMSVFLYVPLPLPLALSPSLSLPQGEKGILNLCQNPDEIDLAVLPFPLLSSHRYGNNTATKFFLVLIIRLLLPQSQ